MYLHKVFRELVHDILISIPFSFCKHIVSFAKTVNSLFIY